MTTAQQLSRFDPKSLTQAISWLLERAGASADIAGEMASALVDAEMLGHSSHGVRLCATYVERLLSGLIDGRARPSRNSVTGPVICIESNRAFGQIVGAFAVAQGVQAAKAFGIAATQVIGSGHMGRNGRWPELAAEAGVASLHFINFPRGASSVTPYGGAEARLTNNPIALGAPHPDGDDVIVDFATGEFSVNGIMLAAENGQLMPSKAIVAADGSLTDDPLAFLGSSSRAMLAFGGYKGFALAVFAEIFAGALSGGGVHDREGGPDAPNNMFSVYCDVAALTSAKQYAEQIRSLIRWIESGRPRDAAAPVTVPGARGRSLRRKLLKDGIPLQAGSIAALARAAATLNALPIARQRWPLLFSEASAA
jgi:uncharacterized oxidoreductase